MAFLTRPLAGEAGSPFGLPKSPILIHHEINYGEAVRRLNATRRRNRRA
jgi:hypothetical protein